MKCESRQRSESSPGTRAENVLLGLLIVVVPLFGGAVYQACVATTQRERLVREASAARALARDVVDELVQVKANLVAREAQVERLLDAATLADDEERELRLAITDWRERHEGLAGAASRKIAELSARQADAERRLDDEKSAHEAERSRLEGNLAALSNQLAATDTELRDAREFAEESAWRNDQLERGARELNQRNDALNRSLSSTRSELESAANDASSARSDASSAEAERDRARRALGRADDVITNLRHVVVRQRREEAQEHSGRPAPRAEPPPIHAETPHPAAAPRTHPGAPPAPPRRPR
ncbi:MAG: hypothetical protein K1X78_11785 [Verrucomicrobiaceae bacterium]|nr:hypothetical protein [Verrucomicrobiaceae bacterium]